MSGAPEDQALEGSEAYYSIATGPTAGTYFPIGSMIATIISHPPGSVRCERASACGPKGLIAVALTSRGSVANVRDVGLGRYDSALAQADIAGWAYRAEEAFAKDEPMTHLRAIARLYAETVHLVVRRDLGIKSVADLKGKRISVDVEGSGTNVAARRILRSRKLGAKSVDLVQVNADRAAALLLARQIDGFFFVGGTPVEVISSLAATGEIDLVPIDSDALIAPNGDMAYFSPVEIGEGVYKGAGPVATVAVGALWITRDTADETLIYDLTQALWDASNAPFLERGHPQARAMSLQEAVVGIPIPLHPGAEKFYREKGVLPPLPPETRETPAPDAPAP